MGVRAVGMVYDMADHRNDDNSAPWQGILSKRSNPSKYTAPVVRSQRDIVNMSRVFARDKYPLEFALLWFMEHYFIPDRTNDGVVVDSKKARKYVRAYNEACKRVGEPYVELV